MAGGANMIKQKTMVAQVKEYVSYKRKLGFQLRIEEGQLLNFAKYADKSGHSGPVTTALILRWAHLPMKASQLYKARRVEVVRCFAKYQAIFFKKTEIPPPLILGPAHRRTEPYIYSKQQISALLDICAEMKPIDGLRPRTYATLFGLIACTGLRISEALKLSRKDVDLENGIVLISETKFHKSRLVPLDISALEALCKYVEFRDQYLSIVKSEKFFLSEKGDSLTSSTVNHTFRILRKKLGWCIEGKRPPRIQDMRHTFACRRLLLWYEEGADINHVILQLVNIFGTCQSK
ncbi:MAG: tyrosine-type recombinase/integrase [Bacteroidales bacterium]